MSTVDNLQFMVLSVIVSFVSDLKIVVFYCSCSVEAYVLDKLIDNFINT